MKPAEAALLIIVGGILCGVIGSGAWHQKIQNDGKRKLSPAEAARFEEFKKKYPEQASSFLERMADSRTNQPGR